MPSAPENLDPSVVALFLDVDGTLLAIRDNPGDVVANPALIELLSACSRAVDGALALVSGRSIEELDRIFAPAVYPAAGAHGSELRFGDGQIQTMAADALPSSSINTLETFVAERPGLLLEHKRGGVSLHCRRAPDLEEACRKLALALMADLGTGFRLIAGKMVFEIAPSAHDKGAAIQSFLEHTPFAGRSPVYIGDDVTDEDAFRAVNQLGGTSIRVGDSRHSKARFELPDVASVQVWLCDAVLGIKATDKQESSSVE